MDPLTIIGLINAGAALIKQITPLAQQALEVAGEEDADRIKAAIVELQAENDMLHVRTQANLRGG